MKSPRKVMGLAVRTDEPKIAYGRRARVPVDHDKAQRPWIYFTSPLQKH